MFFLLLVLVVVIVIAVKFGKLHWIPGFMHIVELCFQWAEKQVVDAKMQYGVVPIHSHGQQLRKVCGIQAFKQELESAKLFFVTSKMRYFSIAKLVTQAKEQSLMLTCLLKRP